MVIKVTRKDRYSSGVDCLTCPVAIAINRALPPGQFAAVYPDYVCIHKRVENRHNLSSFTRAIAKITLPRSARRFINWHDSANKKHKAKPFNFRLAIEYT